MKSSIGVDLGSWVITQRRKYDQLTTEYKEFLQRLPGWTQDKFADNWNQNYNNLIAFMKENGHCNPSQTQAYGGMQIGTWVNKQRRDRWKLNSEKILLLERLDGWQWSIRQDKWDAKYEILREWAETHGHSSPPNGTVRNGINLKSWVQNQKTRGNSVNSTLTEEQRKKLEQLPNWSWNKRDSNFCEMASRLKEYAERHGSPRPPQDYTCEDGTMIGRWLSKQRSRKSTMSQWRRDILDQIGDWE